MSNHTGVSMGTPGHNMVYSFLMIPDLDIYRSAQVLVKHHGQYALTEVAINANNRDVRRNR